MLHNGKGAIAYEHIYILHSVSPMLTSAHIFRNAVQYSVKNTLSQGLLTLFSCLHAASGTQSDCF